MKPCETNVYIVFIFRATVDSQQQRLPTPYSANRVTLRGRVVHIQAMNARESSSPLKPSDRA